MVDILQVSTPFVSHLHSQLPSIQPETLNSNSQGTSLVSCILPYLASFVNESILSPDKPSYRTFTFFQAVTQFARHRSRQQLSHHLICPPESCANHNPNFDLSSAGLSVDSNSTIISLVYISISYLLFARPCPAPPSLVLPNRLKEILTTSPIYQWLRLQPRHS